MKRSSYIQGKRFSTREMVNKYYVQPDGRYVFVPATDHEYMDEDLLICMVIRYQPSELRGGRGFWIPAFLRLEEMAQLRKTVVSQEIRRYNDRDPNNV